MAALLLLAHASQQSKQCGASRHDGENGASCSIAVADVGEQLRGPHRS
jgi:hypothetical protein